MAALPSATTVREVTEPGKTATSVGDPVETDAVRARIAALRKELAAVKEKTGRKGRGLFMPLRHAITGRTRGPEMADVLPLLQKPPRT